MACYRNKVNFIPKNQVFNYFFALKAYNFLTIVKLPNKKRERPNYRNCSLMVILIPYETAAI